MLELFQSLTVEVIPCHTFYTFWLSMFSYCCFFSNLMAVYFFTPLNDFLRPFCPPWVKNTGSPWISGILLHRIHWAIFSSTLSCRCRSIPLRYFRFSKMQERKRLRFSRRNYRARFVLPSSKNGPITTRHGIIVKLGGVKRTGSSLQIFLRRVWFSISSQCFIRIFLRIGIRTEG